jgi:hypothetical protein
MQATSLLFCDSLGLLPSLFGPANLTPLPFRCPLHRQTPLKNVSFPREAKDPSMNSEFYTTFQAFLIPAN